MTYIIKFSPNKIGVVNAVILTMDDNIIYFRKSEYLSYSLNESIL